MKKLERQKIQTRFVLPANIIDLQFFIDLHEIFNRFERHALLIVQLSKLYVISQRFSVGNFAKINPLLELGESLK
jgi:hypothetical protein